MSIEIDLGCQVIGGASTYIELTDTDNSYSGQAGKFPVVNNAETGLEFTAGTGGGLTDGNATKINGSRVDVGNQLLSDTTILGKDKSYTVGTITDLLSANESNMTDSFTVRQLGVTGSFNSFLEFISRGENYSDITLAALPNTSTTGGNQDKIRLIAGSNKVGDWFSNANIPIGKRIGEISLEGNDGDDKTSVLELNHNSTNEIFRIGTVPNVNLPSLTLTNAELTIGITAFKIGGIQIQDLLGLGFTYKDYTVDEANVGSWGSTPNHISSEARIIANMSNKATTQSLVSSTPRVIIPADADRSLNVFGVGSLCTLTVNVGSLSVGQATEVNLGDASGVTVSAGAGANVFGVISGSTTLGDSILIRRLTDDSFGLTGEVYKVY